METLESEFIESLRVIIKHIYLFMSAFPVQNSPKNMKQQLFIAGNSEKDEEKNIKATSHLNPKCLHYYQWLLLGNSAATSRFCFSTFTCICWIVVEFDFHRLGHMARHTCSKE
jgi:hypothetical protein